MQWILSVFAMAFNRLFGLTGHVWGQRFFSNVLVNFLAYLRAFIYIDENPVTACLVKDARDWPFGGLWHNRTGRYDIVGPPEQYMRVACPAHWPLLLMKLE
jgi:putative transposase